MLLTLNRGCTAGAVAAGFRIGPCCGGRRARGPHAHAPRARRNHSARPLRAAPKDRQRSRCPSRCHTSR